MQTKINQKDSQGRRQGYWEEKSFFVEKGLYVDNKREGVWRCYDPDDGPLRSCITYKAGTRDGDYVSYNWDGSLLIKGAYKDGKRHGYWEDYWSNGNTNYKGSYNKGIRVGRWLYGGMYCSTIETFFYAR